MLNPLTTEPLEFAFYESHARMVLLSFTVNANDPEYLRMREKLLKYLTYRQGIFLPCCTPAYTYAYGMDSHDTFQLVSVESSEARYYRVYFSIRLHKYNIMHNIQVLIL